MKTLYVFAIALMLSFSFQECLSQERTQMVRMAKLIIDPGQLESYKAFLKEEIETSLRVEPGVKMLYAISEKDQPTHFTILEIYADKEAYSAHIKTTHFLKYKNGTKDMVKSLELVEAVPLIPEQKTR